METTEFKKIFDELAQQNGFQKAHGGWFIQSPECIVILELQKSNFGNYYELNIKIYVQGCFKEKYTITKELIKKGMGPIFRRQPNEYDIFFDLEQKMEKDHRKEGLKKFFQIFMVPFSTQAMTKKGLKELEKLGEIHLLPLVKEELGIAISES